MNVLLLISGGGVVKRMCGVRFECSTIILCTTWTASPYGPRRVVSKIGGTRGFHSWGFVSHYHSYGKSFPLCGST